MVYSCVTATPWAQVFWRFQMDSENARGCVTKRSRYVVFALLAGVVMLAGPRPACAETTWLVDAVPRPRGQTSLQMAMDADHAAEVLYNLFADPTGHCTVNILDLIAVRNQLQAKCGE